VGTQLAKRFSVLRDLRLALRSLTRSPGFTALVVLTLGLGIGTSTAVFSVVHAVVLRPLEYPEPQQLVRITSELRGVGATDTGVAPAELVDYQSRDDLFRGVAGIMPISATVTADTPARIEMLLVSWSYFSILGVSPAHGRVFGPEDDSVGVAHVAVVSDGFWRRHLGADPRAIGKTITIDTDPIVVVGVMPPGFHHPGRTIQNDIDAWSPSGFRRSPNAPPSRSRPRLESCLARLQPGLTVAHAQTRLAEYGVSASAQYPSAYPTQDGWRPRVVALQESVVGSVASSMFMLLGGVGLLLLIACVNVAHLVLARAAARRQEIAVRKALGANMRQLVRQLATESAVLAAAGGALGLLIASWVSSGLVALAPARVPRIDQVTMDLTVVLVAIGVSLIATVLVGLFPAWQLNKVDTFPAVTDGGSARTTGRASRARDLLVGVEVAMATILLIGAGLLVRSLMTLVNVPLGFETDSLLTARIALPRPNDPARAVYLDPARRVAFYREAVDRIGAIPGVERAAVSSQIPLGGFNAPYFAEIQGLDASGQAVRPVMHQFQVSPGYFETMRVRIVRGRPFSEEDRAGAEQVAIVSQAAVNAFWKGRDPIGARVRFGSEMPWLTVIGVSGDVLNRRLNEPPQPILYRSLEQSSDLSLAVLARTRGVTADFAERIAQEIRAIDADVPIYAVRPMDDVIGSALAQRRFMMRLLVAFGGIATTLALLGIYGVMAYAVAQRRREIGIRMAIGARHVDMSWMVLRRALRLTATGVLVGTAVSQTLSGLVRSQLFGVEPSDATTMTAVFMLMTMVGCAAAIVPARRAASVDPVVALRSQ
jgi:predicted permease